MTYHENLSDADPTGDRALWQSVIMQAAIDATGNPKDIKGKIERAKTIAWFSLENEDFLMVCQFANFEPNSIISGLRRAIKSNKSKNGRKFLKKPKNMHHIPDIIRKQSIA